MSFAQQMVNVKKELLKSKHEVILPKDADKYAEKILAEETAYESTKNKIEHDLIRNHFKKIQNADAILVVNIKKNGISDYIGGNSFLEMGFACILNKPIFILNKIPELIYTDEILAMQPIVLDGDLGKLRKIFTN